MGVPQATVEGLTLNKRATQKSLLQLLDKLLPSRPLAACARCACIAPHGAAATHTIAPCPSPAPCSCRMLSRLKAVLSVRVAGVSGHVRRSVSAAEHVSKACLLGAAGEAAGGCWDGPEPPCQVRCKHPAESLRLAGMHTLWDAGRQRGAQPRQPAVAGSCAACKKEQSCHNHAATRGSQRRVIRAVC